MKITRCCGILLYEQTMTLRLARRPDLLIIDKKAKNCQILDVAIDGRVRAKEGEKVEKYQDLAKEIRMM